MTTGSVGDQSNLFEHVLELYYDRRSEKEQVEQRKGYIDRL